LKTADDYIQAYSEIEVLLPEFESRIQNSADVYKEARDGDENRGLINIQRFYKDNNPEVWKSAYEMLDLLRQFDSLTKQEALTVRKMAALPTREQVEFWQKEIKPLLAEEDDLREKLRLVATKIQLLTN
jgi:hypothetical protein